MTDPGPVLQSEEDDIGARLAQAEETIRAIHFGEVDAVVVNGPRGPQVYTLEGADHPYRVLVEQMHEGTVTLDHNGLILYSNPQFATLVGASGSATGAQFSDFLPSSDISVFRALAEGAMVRGYSSGELNLRVEGRHLIPVRLSLTTLDIAGTQSFTVVVSDLREEKRNAEIVKEERLSRLILEQAGEAIVVIDRDGNIIRRSESSKALVNSSMMLVPFDQVFQLNSGDYILDGPRILAAACKGEKIQGIEASMRRADGNLAALIVSTNPLWSESNELLGCVITLTDITERKRVEEALAMQAGELARSNNDLRQFAYSASHDLREPLRQLAVYSELIQEKFAGKLGDEGAGLIRQAVDSAHRMEKLVKDLLAYIQAADAPQEAQGATDANEVIRKTLATLEMQIAESGAAVQCGPLPILDVHEVHLTQLIQNILGNALKYKGDSTPLISVAAERTGPMWKFSIQDNGIGISRDYQSQIFGLFQRLHGGNKYSGSGIGLAICQKMVQRYGGRIWVESELGQGATFSFTLPGRPM